jgi:3-oxoacyl-[acyl-carrier-protein] synthase II
VMAIREGLVPPTINLDDPIEEADGLDLVPGQARQTPVSVAMSNSFGFGGANVSLVFKRHD